MKRGSTIFLRGVVVMFGLAVLALCLFVLPRVIGTFDMGGYDPILVGMYVPAIPFFIGIYQTLKLLSYIDRNQAFSDLSVKGLKTIKYCALAIGVMYALGMPYIFKVADQDDSPGVVLIGLIFTFAPLVIAIFSAVLQKILEEAIAIKSENDLTV